MRNNEKITQKDNRLNEAQLFTGTHFITTLHTQLGHVSEQFYLSKKFKKLAYGLAKEVANLDPKDPNDEKLDVTQVFQEIVDSYNLKAV